LRIILNARRIGKKRPKGIEEGSRCPSGRKKSAEGNRRGLSMPSGPEKEVQREQKMILNALWGGERSSKGTENDSQCPPERKKGFKGNLKPIEAHQKPMKPINAHTGLIEGAY
jgi:hypothetical protein